MRAIFRLTSWGILLTAIGAWAQTPNPRVKTSTLDLSTIVSRMQTAMAGRNHERAYSVTREYKLAPEDARKTARVVAEINTVPSGKKDYRITEGSGQAENIIRKVLDHEKEAANDHSTSGEIVPQNYDFAYLGTTVLDGHNCYVLGLQPHHNAKDVLNGKVWVDSESYLIRQVAGAPVKTPSWWIKDVQFTLHYSDMRGVWVQDSAQAIAQVRIVGKHTLSSRALDVRTDSALASSTATSKRARRTDPALLGAGVFSHR
jgi:hypothetical protein